MQIHADVRNVPITLTEAGDSAAMLGSAALASVAAGICPSARDAAQAMVRIKSQIITNADTHDAYRFYFEQYAATYPQMHELMHTMTRHMTEK